MAVVYCFTSTGNSLYAAKKLAAALGGQVQPMEEGAVCNDDVIGFVFPNFFWGPPRIVERFVQSLQITNKNAYIFAVMACGGPGFGALGFLKKPLREKGVELNYARLLVCSSNYLPEFSPKDTPAVRAQMEKKLAKITGDLQSRKEKHVISPTAFNRYAQSLYPGSGSDQYFTVSSACTGCGTCEKICPVRNIALEDGKPAFQHHCEHCIACVHHCPAKALDWKDAKTRGKPRYRNANVGLGELLELAGGEGNTIS